ncbi:hypothetical protein OZX61_07290 [Acinetobacter sp. ESL0695]|uniref:hypothetical protein n=1 Tax=Acinetobacter sp. ESL0695 TaxID=2983215 RepID=UPI0023F057A1|nr:hypothetical protein [Acinetobacter sp. ESL0695]WEV48093.1 hypothetical protein OZX61_07290 [Acinetobacter sp. ESL0695]
MTKILAGLSLIAITSFANAASVSLEYTGMNAKSQDNNGTSNLNGIGLGISSNPTNHGLWAKTQYQHASKNDVDYFDIAGGVQYNFIANDDFYLLGKLGLGFATASSSALQNNVNFITLPVGLEAGYSLTQRFSVYGGLGYKFLWEVTKPTTCNNGTQSNSTGRGTCSSNGGINHYNDKAGDFNGVTYNVGLRYNF